MTSRHRYPPAGLLSDMGRAVLGLAVVVTPLAAVPLHPILAGFLAILAILFASFAIRTGLRYLRHIEVTEDGITSSAPRPVTLAWDRLDRMGLRYYATRRDRKDGWMQLSLRAGRHKLSIDSQIESFHTIVNRATQAAMARRLPLDDVTRANLAALDIDVGDADALDIGIGDAGAGDPAAETTLNRSLGDDSTGGLAGVRG